MTVLNYFCNAFLHFTISSFSQVMEVCIGDTIDFRSSPYVADNDFEWEFILDAGANIIGGQNDSVLESILTILEIVFCSLRACPYRLLWSC